MCEEGLGNWKAERPIGIYDLCICILYLCIHVLNDLTYICKTCLKGTEELLKWAFLRTSLLFGKVIQTESIVFAAGFQLLIKHAHVTRPLLALCAGWLGKDLWCARALH